MFRGRRRHAPDGPDDDRPIEPDDGNEPNGASVERPAVRGTWLSDLPDIQYPAMADLLDEQSAAARPTTTDATPEPPGGANPAPMTRPATDSDELMGHAATAFEALQETATTAIVRIKEAGRDVESAVDQLATHRGRGLDREAAEHARHLATHRDELLDSLREAMIDLAVRLEERSSAHASGVVVEQGGRLQQVAEAQAELIGQAAARGAEHVRDAGRAAIESLEEAQRRLHDELVAVRQAMQADLAQARRDLRGEVERERRRVSGTRRLFVVALGIVAALAVTGVVLAARASGDVPRPEVVEPPASTRPTTTTSTSPPSTVAPPTAAPATAPITPAESSPSPTAGSPGTAAPVPPPPAPTPPGPLCTLLGLCP